MSKKSRPIVVKLVQRNAFEGDRGLMLGDLSLCGDAAGWLREQFPSGGSFRDAWLACPVGEWLAYVIETLSRHAGREVWVSWNDTPDSLRKQVPYERIEGWLRRAMRGCPEVIG